MLSANQISATPFQKIALSMSGGGYRAASFHLGSLAYLNHLTYQNKPLLEQVSMISTVSGGTITGIVYALGQQNGQSFDQIFDYLMKTLQQVDLVKEGLTQLNPDAVWDNKTKRKNLINAFANLYDKHFTKGATLGMLEAEGHLEHIVFNSTEFNHAVNFRFRNRQAGYSGNHYMRYNTPLTNEIKLSDVMAASSCFPGGFEPLLWPHDFVHEAAPALAALAKANLPVGIMDGGIYDNQGIDSILNYKDDSKKPPYFDLVIISDVASPDMAPFKPFQENPKKGLFTKTIGEIRDDIGRFIIQSTWALLLLILLFALLPACWNYTNSIASGIMLAIAGVMLLLLIGKLWLVAEAKKVYEEKAAWFRATYKGFYLDKISALDFNSISLHRAQPLIMDRINSLATLLMDVFLKVVRRLNYNRLYQDDRYQYRRISNLIKELISEDSPGIKQSKTKATENTPTAANELENIAPETIGRVAGRAAAFGTTLWFTEEENDADLLNDLVATGQFTMCYNLLQYLERITTDSGSGFAELPPEAQKALQETRAECQRHWEQFTANPYYLID
ncbi:patatin-like phospholipase family protein [Mucilaginibacter sp. Bleaf8]|uniref:patatin-like phospholipase family protein n=1 Tax=Mucilaginibacter sp. Bleaf8 TaxID=2834430 RepID=UPI001BCAC52B|nr:patatin-like phospholipase family protein [Mucilaginibacter sp. Bleaf8]MBS7566801.1 patatin-like phospholipase family protein [Mucilaginibacter sp. Bleaf8]